MSTVSCPSCELPNDRKAHRCHACGTRLHPEVDEQDPALLQLEERLVGARNHLADLDWRVRGAGWVAAALVLLLVLVAGPAVGHPTLGGAVDCGSPLGALLGDYQQRYAATVWDGCAEGAEPWAAVAVASAAAGAVGLALLGVRAARLRGAVRTVRRLQAEVRSTRARQEEVRP